MARRRSDDDVLGNRRLDAPFEVCIIGSGAGGGTAAHVLAAAGKSVLVLEAGPNLFPGLDRRRALPFPLHSNDEVKYAIRNFIMQDPFLEPRTFRADASRTARLSDDVNVLPKAVGGAFQHADMKTPRFNAVDFRLKSAVEALGASVPGFGADAASANFADWPFTYDDLEPFYVEAEQLYGVQGDGDNVYESARSRGYPMPAGLGMYFNLLIADAARKTTVPDIGLLQPHTFPAAINSRFSRTVDPDAPDDRPPCVDCGLCSGFGCPNNSKNSPAVTALRRALLTGRCQLRANAHVTRLLTSGGVVTAAEYLDGDGNTRSVRANAFVLAASAIESARLCLLSDPDGPGLGNSSGQVGRNLMFHLQTNVNCFLPRRVHGQRGRAVTHGISDFRGVQPGGDAIRVFAGNVVALGGICEFGASQGLPITEDGLVYTTDLPSDVRLRSGIPLKNALRDQALGQHLMGLIMQAEDAPQLTNRVELDARYRDVYGLPVPSITYKSHPFELAVRAFYLPHMKTVLRQVLRDAAVPEGEIDDRIFVTPLLPEPPSTRHIMGTLRLGSDPATSVVNAQGRFHDVQNLYACDGSVFPTSSGYNPTLTIVAVALKIAHGM
jgi:gluconate 2-dehydrogenase alpha chain